MINIITANEVLGLIIRNGYSMYEIRGMFNQRDISINYLINSHEK